MLVMAVWSGCVLASPTRKEESVRTWRAHAKLNDKFLGYLNVPKVNNVTSNDDLVSLRDLQAQGAQLLKHAFRPKEYLIVCVGSFELPTLTYTLDCNSRRFNKRVTKRFRALLASTEPHRVTLSWDEDDTKALKSIVTSWSMSSTWAS